MKLVFSVMYKKSVFLFIGLLWVLLGFKSEAQVKKRMRPNVIIINIDDMGYGDTEPYGMTGIATSNFNKVAQQGMRFTHFNVAQAVCSPSRAALLTGCYPNRLGLHHALRPDSKIALSTSEETIAALLKEVGYKTGMVGKWHLGSKAPNLPIHYGFDSYYGIPYSHDMWPVDYDGNALDSAHNKGRYPQLPLLDGDRVVGYNKTLDDQAKLTGTFTKKVVEFIKDNQKSPFFLYLAQPMPHVPLAASPKFKGKSEIGLFGDVIMELDWSIGEILNTLDQLKLSSNTILFITSDNGPWLKFGDNAGSSGGFREGKGTTWDGGTRVPFLVRWPGKVAQGSVNNQLLVNLDILPTILDITKAPQPKKRFDGVSFADILLGRSTKAPRDVFYYYYDVNSLKAVRYKNWKLVLPHRSQSYVAGTLGKNGHPGTALQVQVKMALYNLAHDPSESFDVQDLYPAMVNKIMEYVEDARADLGDELVEKKGANRREPDKVIFF